MILIFISFSLRDHSRDHNKSNSLNERFYCSIKRTFWKNSKFIGHKLVTGTIRAPPVGVHLNVNLKNGQNEIVFDRSWVYPTAGRHISRSKAHRLKTESW